MWKPLFVLSIAATVVVAFPDLGKWSFSVKEVSICVYSHFLNSNRDFTFSLEKLSLL